MTFKIFARYQHWSSCTAELVSIWGGERGDSRGSYILTDQDGVFLLVPGDALFQLLEDLVDLLSLHAGCLCLVFYGLQLP